MTLDLPRWVEITVAVLLVASGLFTLTAAWGIVRLKDFFQRLHPPALASSGAAWCVTLASIVFFSAARDDLSLKSWLIIIILSITVPITTALLARAALFRRRQQGDTSLPSPLQPQGAIDEDEEAAPQQAPPRSPKA